MTTTNLAGRGFEFPGAVLAGLGAYILAEAFAYRNCVNAGARDVLLRTPGEATFSPLSRSAT